MTIDQLKSTNWIVFQGISGSIAYGTDIPGSDIDIRGIYIQPLDHIMGFKYVPQIVETGPGQDETFYEIRRFMELLRKNNPNILELLNLPPDCIQYAESVYWDLHRTRHDFLHRGVADACIGMVYSQISEFEKKGRIKSLVHSIRVVNMVEDIVDKNEIIVRRPDEEIDLYMEMYMHPERIDIQDITSQLDEKIQIVKKKILRAEHLESRPSRELFHETLVKIRKRQYDLT